MERKSWNDFFMEVTNIISTRSTCLRRKVGAILVKDKRIIATGYNGAPPKVTHCSERGCLREKLNIPSGERQEICFAQHAEANAVAQAAKFGIPIKGSTCYCTTQPCVTCLKLLMTVEVKAIYFEQPYNCETVSTLLKDSLSFVGSTDYGVLKCWEFAYE